MNTPKGRATEVPKLYETESDILRSARSELGALINQRLSDSLDLQLQLKQAHWNVKDHHFIGLHELFDKIAEQVESYVDEIAGRIAQLGGIAQGTVRVAGARSRLDGRHGKDQSQFVEYSLDEHRLLSLATMQPVLDSQAHDFHPRWGINE